MLYKGRKKFDMMCRKYSFFIFCCLFIGDILLVIVAVGVDNRSLQSAKYQFVCDKSLMLRFNFLNLYR